MGLSKSKSKKEVYNNTGLTHETTKILNTVTCHIKKLEKEKQSPDKAEENNKRLER